MRRDLPRLSCICGLEYVVRAEPGRVVYEAQCQCAAQRWRAMPAAARSRVMDAVRLAGLGNDLEADCNTAAYLLEELAR